jgi:beta-lactam-binding protein with PASTA domain
MKRSAHISTTLLVAIVLTAILSGCGSSGSSSGNGTSSGSSSGNVASSGSSSGNGTTAGASSSASFATSSPSAHSGVVPEVDGVAVDVAELYLKEAGLTSGQKVQETNSNVPDGFVITSQPPVGEQEAIGTAVELIISKGSAGCQPGPSCPFEGHYGIMINILGQTLPEATTSLALSGLTLGSSTIVDSSATKGTIVCTNPQAGVSFLIQAPVSVGISSGIPGGPTTSGCGGPSSATSPTPTPFTAPAESPTTSASAPAESPTTSGQ